MKWNPPRLAPVAAIIGDRPAKAAADDLQAATIELMHSISRLAVATFASELASRANNAQLYEFANIITDALHDYAGPSR